MPKQPNPAKMMKYLARGDSIPVAARKAQADIDRDRKDSLETGERLLKAHDYKGALFQFNNVLAVKPNDQRANAGAGMALVGLGDHEHAIPKFENALRFDPANHEGRFALMMSRLHLGYTGEGFFEHLGRLKTYRPDLAEKILAKMAEDQPIHSSTPAR